MNLLHVYDCVINQPKRLVEDFNILMPNDTHIVMALAGEVGAVANVSGVILFREDENGFEVLLEQMKTADRIIWHGFYWRRKFLMKLIKEWRCLKKSIWHVCERDTIERQYSGFNPIKRIYHSMKLLCKKSMAAYAVENIETYYRVKNIYGHNKNVYLVSCRGDQALARELKSVTATEESVTATEESVTATEGEERPCNILIGSDGFKEQNHTKIINLLSRFMYENIRVHIPLVKQEANVEYVEQIKSIARKVFGHKVVFYENPFTLEERVNLYKQIDIGVFFSGRHHSLQDILALSYMRKTVYCADALRKHPSLREVERTLKRINDLPEKEDLMMLAEKMDVQMVEEIDWDKVLKTLETFDFSDNWKEIIHKGAEGRKKVKFLHIIPPRENIIQPFVELVQEYFPLDEHYFLVSNNNIKFAPGLAQRKNVEFEIGPTVTRRLKYVFKRLGDAEYIVFHSMYLSRWEIGLLAFSPKILKKAAWVEWGKDLYDYKKPANSIKNWLHNYLHTRIRENISCFVSIFPPDELKFREQFKNQAPIMQVSYVAFNSIDMLEKTRPAPKEHDSSKSVRIQVAHSCNSWNNHNVILDSLAHFKFENIELQIPLSTGAPSQNKKAVEKYARFLFAHKANFLWDEMDKENYFKFMWSVDIAVFCLYRQAALGNIIRLLYMGKKVFLPRGSVMYNFFTENGVEIYDTEAIPNMTYEEFTAPLKSQAPHPFIVKMMHQDDLVKAWSAVFQYLKNNTK